MTVEEIKSQLYELIEDRKSLKSGNGCDVVDNDIYDNDITALTEAINAVSCVAEMANIAKTKTAHWDINCDGYYPLCSHCGESPAKMSKYCPNCGARIVTRVKER